MNQRMRFRSPEKNSRFWPTDRHTAADERESWRLMLLKKVRRRGAASDRSRGENGKAPRTAGIG